MTKAPHLSRAPEGRAKLTTPDNGPGYTPTKRPGTVTPNGIQKRWSSGQMVSHVELDTGTNLFKRPDYDGAELRPYEGRTDANDHMQHGSVVGGKWTPYTLPGLMCVGAAGPVAIGSSSGASRGRFAA